MSISKFFKIIPFLCIVAFACPQKTVAAVHGTTIPSDSADYAQRIIGIKSRLAEIQHMDKANLTSADRKELRNELKEMKHEVAGKGKGIYLSVGAILIIIILLLIILL